MNGINLKRSSEWWQHRILRFLIDYKAQHGEMPVVRDICEAMKPYNSEGKPMNVMSVSNHLKRMVDAGFITKTPRKYRAIKLTDKGIAYAKQEDWQKRD